MTATKRQHRAKQRAKAIMRKPHAEPVYGPRWGAWIMSNVRRDLRSGALRVNAEGATIH
jgi:hypothetical protein